MPRCPLSGKVCRLICAAGLMLIVRVVCSCGGCLVEEGPHTKADDAWLLGLSVVGRRPALMRV